MIKRIVLGFSLLAAMCFCAFYTITRAGAAAAPKQGATVTDKDTADKITEVEALRFENKFLKLQQVQAACEAQPQYKQALQAFNDESVTIAAAHHMDVKPDGSGDKFDVTTRQITRKLTKAATASATPEKKG